jgi:hypothetical protein
MLFKRARRRAHYYYIKLVVSIEPINVPRDKTSSYVSSSSIDIDRTIDVMFLCSIVHLVLGIEFNVFIIESTLFKFNSDTVCVIVVIMLYVLIMLLGFCCLLLEVILPLRYTQQHFYTHQHV